jgi:hypothetical protein
MIAAREVGGLKKAWSHGNPTEPRANHVEMERRYAGGIPLEAPFVLHGENGVFECDAPGDPNLPVEEVANCTCGIEFVRA